jgi:hypothetical protein
MPQSDDRVEGQIPYRDAQAALIIRCAVAALIRIFAPIWRKLRPSSWRRRTLSRSTTFCGRPRCSVRPWRRSLAIAAGARSDRRTRSCLAIVARIESTASRKMPQESKYSSVKLRQLTPAAVNRSRWFSVADTPSLESLSKDQKSKRSNLQARASANMRWKCSRFEVPPVSWSTYSSAIAHPCFAQYSRSANWFSVSFSVSECVFREMLFETPKPSVRVQANAANTLAPRATPRSALPRSPPCRRSEPRCAGSS